jgi:hypothetical protein
LPSLKQNLQILGFDLPNSTGFPHSFNVHVPKTSPTLELSADRMAAVDARLLVGPFWIDGRAFVLARSPFVAVD